MTPRRPEVVVLDVNETLSDLSAMGERFADVGAPASLAGSWFAGVLRDGFALTVHGVNEPFAALAEDGLRTAFAGVDLDRPLDAAVRHVLDGFSGLSLHPDVAPGLRDLAEAGVRVVTLSNGAASVAEDLLERAGVRDHVWAVLSVDDAGGWKPARTAYAHALERCAVGPDEAMLVAVHPWDVDGAARAGLATAWLDRDGRPYPSCFTPADVRVDSLPALAAALGSS